jgi:hypothetical protein
MLDVDWRYMIWSAGMPPNGNYITHHSQQYGFYDRAWSKSAVAVLALEQIDRI